MKMKPVLDLLLSREFIAELMKRFHNLMLVNRLQHIIEYTVPYSLLGIAEIIIPADNNKFGPELLLRHSLNQPNAVQDRHADICDHQMRPSGAD